MKTRVLAVLMGLSLWSAPALAQKTVTGRVTSEAGAALPGVSIRVGGTNTGTVTGAEGSYSVRAAEGQVLQFRLLGHAPEERTVGAANVINVTLRRVATSLDAIVVTALGETAAQRVLGTAQQTVEGTAIAETQRTNFVNALQGRVAGVEVTSSSGVPGASSQITIRGISSISSSNQPLFIIDGLPLDNKTLHTGVLASATSGATSFENRGIDFSNRAADINPEDIETLTVLKGPEAAALYGIDAANGAIVITTKRGRAGTGGFEYVNSFRFEATRRAPQVQHVYGQSTTGSSSLLYWGDPYAPGTKLYDNVAGFFQTPLSQKHNLTFSGASPDSRINYRLSGGLVNDRGIVPNSRNQRLNVTGTSGAQVTRWMKVDLAMIYSYSNNDQPFKGPGGPLLGLLVWPQTDDARDFLTPAGARRRIATTISAGSEVDNPYFNVEKNNSNQKNTRFNTNLGLVFTPFRWGNIRTNLGADTYTTQTQILRHPESAWGFGSNGIIDVADDVTRNLNLQTLLNVNRIGLWRGLALTGLVGNQVRADRSKTDAMVGTDFLEPNFVSVNNTNLRTNLTTLRERRLVGLFGQATIDFEKYLFLNFTGRNDWTSTIPTPRNSFFFPGASASFVFSDAFPAIARFVTGKVRAAYAEVGKDASPYAYTPSLQYKTTSYGGYGFDFWGPNPGLKPEFKTSKEFGAELSFLDDRLYVEPTVWRAETRDQIVNNIRSSYGTGFILLNLNGGVTRNEGLELVVRGTPLLRRSFSWDVNVNLDRSRGRVIALPANLPETYNSDTWLYGNIRNGTAKGMSTRSLTGAFYRRNRKGDILVDPGSGLPIRNTDFVDAGYDRQPDWTAGVENRFRYGKLSFSVLLDIRRGGDVLNATEHYLTVRGLSPRTLDRDQPRVIRGVLRDGKENTDTPTRNTIVISGTSYYQNMSEELFLEKDINWLRLRDVTIRYELPQRFGRNASVFVQGNDLWLKTNYTGMDPIVNGNTAAVGGSGSVGIDLGNFPIPRGFNFGFRTGF